MANEYVTAAELKTTLSLTGETFADADIALAVEAASRLVDNLCGRRFWVDPSDVTRYYTPTTSGLVTIDDLATVTSVASDIDSAGTYTETLVENTDYHFEPLNAAADGWARTRLVIHPNSAFVDFPAGERRSVRVVGKFGWPAVPPAVKQATAIVAARLMRRSREAPFGVVALGTEGEAMRIGRVDPDVQMLLNPYVRSFFA